MHRKPIALLTLASCVALLCFATVSRTTQPPLPIRGKGTHAMNTTAQATGPSSAAGSTITGFLRTTLSLNGREIPQVVYLPPNYSPEVPHPAIVFLHGRSESGTDGWKQMGQGLGRAIIADATRWPFVVVMPQKPDQSRQWADYTEDVLACLADAKARFNIDPDRVTLTGLSQGGAGTWAIGASHPHLWNALVPICGFGDAQSLAPKVADMPIWCFHGDADDIILPEESRKMVAAMKAAGGQPVYTEYPGVNHNSWDRAYAEAELPAWILSKRRRAK
jgi:predicted peptidase